MIFGVLRTVAYIVGVWFIWRWLDRTVGGRRGFGPTRQRPNPGNPKRQANDSKEGEYVDFEEVKD